MGVTISDGGGGRRAEVPWWVRDRIRRLRFTRAVALWVGVVFLVCAGLPVFGFQVSQLLLLGEAGALFVFARSADRDLRRAIRDGVLRQLEGPKP